MHTHRDSYDTSGLRIEGYAAVFDRPDQAQDVIRPGAFHKSIEQHKDILTSPRRVRMLYQHAADKPIGRWIDIREDKHGLFVSGVIFDQTHSGKDISVLVQHGAIDGLSIGFKSEKSRQRPDGGRDLLAVSLWEVSLVTFPMAPAARISRVQSSSARHV